jgi:Na+-transporting NADH:ubiquinone oxidoreductase subunit C
MKNFSNLYIFVFSSAMVIVVAALLSFVAEELKPMQERNVELEKKTDILRSVNMTEGMDEAQDRDVFIEERFSSFISESYVVNSEGEVQEGLDAFEVTKDLKAEIDKPAEERNLPVFIFETSEGDKNYIIPVRGKGLWGPIWGYVAIENDFSTISGTVFDHAKETPGLGAEIKESWFQAKFVGKKIFNEQGEFTSINVVKGGADPNDPHSVDGVSGGTITSVGLEDMLVDCLSPYITFFKQQMN